MINFAYNRSSWDAASGSLLPGSMADLIGEPIQEHLTAMGVEFSISRDPVEGAMNLYSSARAGYESEQPGRELSVLLSHGIADKGIRAQHATEFDYVIAPSPRIQKTMLLHAPERRIPVLGYTKLDPIFRARINHVARDNRIRVLYAPTQGGGSDMMNWDDAAPPNLSAARRSSWWRRAEILDRLDPDVFDVVFCPHPRYAPGNRATLEQYVDADVVIADGGSTVWESMILGIPLVLPRWIVGEGHRGVRTWEAELYSHTVGRHADSAAELPTQVLRAFQEGPTAAEEAYGLAALPIAFRGTSGIRHAEWIVQHAELLTPR